MNDNDKPDLSLVVNNEICKIGSPEYLPLIPEGNYHFKLVTHETALKFGKPRLVMSATIIDTGEQYGVLLPCYRNVDSLKGKAGKKGGFVPPRGGDFMIEYCKLLPDHNPRRDRISLNPYYNNIIVAKVETVKKNNRGKTLPKQLWWSKIGELLKLTEELPT
jgi:hypothetical protein